MKGSLSRFWPFLGTLAFVVACTGGQNLNPASYAGGSTAQTDALRAALADRYPPDVVDRLMPYATKGCGTKLSATGTYSIFAGYGAVKSGTFTGDSKSLWLYATLVPTNKPVASPSADPSIEPGQPVVLYFGTYTLKKTGHGCVIMEDSKHGFLKPEKYSAFAVGFPSIETKDKYFKYKLVNQGPLAITISGVTAVGSGTVTLNQTGGGVFDSGTVSNVIRLP